MSLVTYCQFTYTKLCAATVMPTCKVQMFWSLCIICCIELHSGWFCVSAWYICWIQFLLKFNFSTGIFMGSMLEIRTQHYFCLVINLSFVSLLMWIPRITGIGLQKILCWSVRCHYMIFLMSAIHSVQQGLLNPLMCEAVNSLQYVICILTPFFWHLSDCEGNYEFFSAALFNSSHSIYRMTQKKRELLKNPTKIEEIQEKKCIDRNWTITTCLLRDSNPNYQCLKITSCRRRPPPRMHSFTATTHFKSSRSFVSPCERMHTWRRTPSTGRNFQTLIIWITVP